MHAVSPARIYKQWNLTARGIDGMRSNFHSSARAGRVLSQFQVRLRWLFFVGSSDPYVKVKVGDKLYYKTKTIYRDLNPFWDESFILPINDITQPVVFRVRLPTTTIIILIHFEINFYGVPKDKMFLTFYYPTAFLPDTNWSERLRGWDLLIWLLMFRSLTTTGDSKMTLWGWPPWTWRGSLSKSHRNSAWLWPRTMWRVRRAWGKFSSRLRSSRVPWMRKTL